MELDNKGRSRQFFKFLLQSRISKHESVSGLMRR